MCRVKKESGEANVISLDSCTLHGSDGGARRENSKADAISLERCMESKKENNEANVISLERYVILELIKKNGEVDAIS
jgi:hypothetical protein